MLIQTFLKIAVVSKQFKRSCSFSFINLCNSFLAILLMMTLLQATRRLVSVYLSIIILSGIRLLKTIWAFLIHKINFAFQWKTLNLTHQSSHLNHAMTFWIFFLSADDYLFFNQICMTKEKAFSLKIYCYKG